LNSNSVVYSFGIGENISFDLDLIKQFGLTVHAFDPTPRSIAWVRTQKTPPGFIIHDYGIADFDGEISFSPPENSAHVSYTILDRPATASQSVRLPVKKISTIMRELGQTRIDLFKMDIEGAEYQVITDLAASAIRPAQLCIEFHHRFQGVGVQKTRTALEQLRAIGYQLYYVSPSGDEYSFILQEQPA
jgi:FkbM family methyltransferase